MKNILLATIILLCSTSLYAQNKSRFKTISKSTKSSRPQWDGSFSFGNAFFLGDLKDNSSESSLLDVVLSTRFSKEFNKKYAIQFAISTGKNSGQNEFDNQLPKGETHIFKSNFLQGSINYRLALSSGKAKKTGRNTPRLHLNVGAGYYYADAHKKSTIERTYTTGTDIQIVHTYTDITFEDKNVWSFVIPAGLELSYYTNNDWGVLMSVMHNLYLSDDLDLYDSKINGYDNQIMLHVGMCYKFD